MIKFKVQKIIFKSYVGGKKSGQMAGKLHASIPTAAASHGMAFLRPQLDE